MRFAVITLLALSAALASPCIAAAQLTIAGRVTGESGQPLPGARVTVRGTTISTAAGSDGRYQLVVPQPGARTVVDASFVGYGTRSTTLSTTSGVAEADFVLAMDALRLDELVVTGTSAATERRQLGNAVASVSGAEIAKSQASAIDAALSGKIPGVVVAQNSGNPSGGVSVRLRGTSTILGSAEPLYIVDGIIVNNDSPELLYLGGYTQNRLVDLDPNNIERIEVVKGAAAAALYGSRANNGVVQIFTKRGSAGAPRFTLSTQLSMDQIRKTLEVNEYPFDADGNPVQRYDWQDVIFQTAPGVETSLQVSGGTPATRYFVSGSYLNREGIVRGAAFQRSNARARLDQTLTDWASVSVGGAYSYSHNDEIPNGGLGTLYGAIDGFLFGPNTIDPHPDETTGAYPNGNFANPIEVADRYDFQQGTNRFLGDVHLTLTPLEGLSMEYTLGYDSYTQTATAFIPRGVTTPGIYQLGYSERGTREFSQLNNDLNVRYRRMLTESLESTSLLGATVQQEVSSTVGLSSYDLTPLTQVVNSGGNRSMSEFRSKRVVEGVFAQETFGLGNRLFLTAAGRLDASSVFGVENRWQFYPKVSGSYLISEEGFWGSSGLGRLFPDFKVRAAWGNSGGLSAIGAFDRFTIYNPISYEANPGLIPSRQQGSDIRPERQTAIEAGADMSILSNRLALEVTLYKQHTDDLLLTRTIALSTGFSTRLENAGEIDNRGIEVQLRAIPLDRPDLTWTTTATYSANRNEVNGIDGGVRVLAGSWGLAAAMNGYPLGTYYAQGYERDAQGQILATDGSPYLDPKTQIPARANSPSVIGDPNPDWAGSLTNEFTIRRNLTVRAQLDAVVGQDVWNYDRRIGAYPPYGTLKDYEKELRGDVATGTGRALWTNFEAWVEDGSFVKLRELSASYAFHPRWMGADELRLTLAGRNLVSFDNYTGYDPETNAGGQSTGTRGYQFGEVPIPRSISFGVTTTF